MEETPAVRRSWRSSALRYGAVVIVVGCILWFILSNWDQVVDSLVALDPALLIAAVGVAMVGVGCAMLAWRGAMKAVGVHIAVRDASQVYFVGQLAKYVPGSVWAVMAQAELGRRYGAPRAVTMTASLLQMLVSVLTGIVVGGVGLLLSGPEVLAVYWWVFPIALVGGIGLLPPAFRWGVRLLGRLVRRPELASASISARGLGACVAWCIAMWVAFGAHFAAILFPLLSSGQDAIVAASTYAFAWVVGFVIIILPAGAGAREGVLMLTLAPIVGATPALAAALVSRFVMLVADVLVAGVGAATAALRGRTAGSAPAPSGPPATSD